MKKVVVVSSSFRAASTSRVLTEEMVKGLKENNNVSLIDLRKINCNYCVGCMACQNTGKCIQKDDINGLLEEIESADVLVFVTPIYYYSISGQLKTFLDRLNPLYVSEKRRFKEIYALFTCADDAETAVEGPTKAIEGWVSCFDGVSLIKTFDGLAVNDVEDITDELKIEAYNFGKEIK